MSVPPLVLQQWWATSGFLLLILALVVTAGIGPLRMLRMGWVIWTLLAGLAIFQLVTLNPVQAVVRPGNILVAILAARMLTLTTSTPALMDALARALVPLRLIRIDPEQAVLAVALMIRSIPYLLGSVDEARDAARARGLDRNPARLLTPVVLGAVGYAERTAEAIQARGLGEPEE